MIHLRISVESSLIFWLPVWRREKARYIFVQRRGLNRFAARWKLSA